MSNLNIKRSMVAALIERHKGKYFSVDFIKKDGSLRSMTCQLGEKELHRGINPIKHLAQYITVCEVNAQGKTLFKNINTDTMRKLTISGSTYQVVD